MGVETAGMMAMAAIGGMAAADAMAPNIPVPKIPDPIQPLRTNPAKAPDRNSIMSNLQAAATGGMAGNSSTFLTGPAGIEASGLNLGKNTLLGR